MKATIDRVKGSLAVLCIALRFTHKIQTFMGKCRVLQVILKRFCIIAFKHKSNLYRFCHEHSLQNTFCYSGYAQRNYIKVLAGMMSVSPVLDCIVSQHFKPSSLHR